MTMDDAQKAVLAWMAIEERIAKRKSLKGMEKEFATAMKFVEKRGPAAAIELFEVSHALKNGGWQTPAQPAATAPPKRYARVVWDVHKGKDERKVRWTCTWEGMKLRVEHTTDQTGLVVFKGFIGDEEVANEKKLSFAQQAVTGKAMERVKTRDTA